MAVIRDVKLSRIALPTVESQIKEAVGDALQAVGAGVVPGERRPRTIDLSLPLRGNASEADPFSAGYRLRRQVRALMENGPARLQGLYFNWTQDPEQNGWLVIGTGDVAYNEGALVLADFQLEMSDVYRVGKLRSHRPARRLEIYDRRVSTTPRDILGLNFGTDFASLSNYVLPLHVLPVGASDMLGANRRIVTAGYRPSVAGNVPIIANASAAEVISYEWAEAYMHGLDDVVVYDRQSKGDPPATFASVMMGERPLAYYRLGEAAGASVMNDTSRSRINGAYMNSAVLGSAGATGDGDTAASFTGGQTATSTANTYARVPDNATLDVTGDLTLIEAFQPSASIWATVPTATPFYTNLVKNPGAEVDTAGWTNNGLTTFARQTGWFAAGSASFRVTSGALAAAGQQSASTASGTGGMPVAAGLAYSGSAIFNVQARTGTASGYLQFDWYDSGGAYLSSAVGTNAVTATGITTMLITAVAPANAAFLRFQFIAYGGASGGTIDYYADAAIVTQSATVQTYGDGSMPGWVWNGTAHNSTSQRLGFVNMSPNPGLEVDASNWTAEQQCTTARSTTTFRNGAASLAATATGANPLVRNVATAIPVLPGETYSTGMYVKSGSVARNWQANVRWYTSAGAFVSDSALGTSTATTTTDWTLVKVEGVVAPATAAFGAIMLRAAAGGVANGEPIYFDDHMFNQGATLLTHFDGGYMTAYWTGTAGTSTSVLTNVEGLISKAKSATGGRSYRMGVDRGTGEIVVGISSDGTSETLVRSTGAAITTNGLWSLLGAVYNSAAGQVSFYRNGQQLGTSTGLPTSIFANTTRYLTLGKWEAD